jgi:tight adherence protein B
MSSAIVLSSTAAAVALISAAVLYLLGRRSEYSSVVTSRVRVAGVLEPAWWAIVRPETPAVLRWVLEQMGRAGIDPAPWQVWVLGGGIVAAMVVGGMALGVVGAVVLAATFLLGVYLFLLWQARKRRGQIVEQLPTFLDHVIRALSAGNSVETGLTVATDASPDPICVLFERVIRQVRLGGALDHTLEQTAKLYRLQELNILTLAVRVNQRYGGHIEGTFKNIIALIRQRQRARRELRSLTAETRFSAWVLVLESIGLVFYILWMNPRYLQTMWYDPVGWIILLAAGVLQVTGSIILWRMVKSI